MGVRVVYPGVPDGVVVAGVDDEGPQLFVTDVTGIYFQYKATAVGEAEAQIKEMLEKDYDEKMDLEEGTKLGLSALKKAFGKDFDMERIDGAYIKTSEKAFKRMDREYLRKLSKKV